MEAEVKEVDESNSFSTLDTPQLKTYSRPNKKGLSAKLEILQDFGVSDEDMNNEGEDEMDTSKKENTNNIDKNVKGVQPVDNSELPVKLPPDITVLKEVVETPTPEPPKRKRGRPKRIPLDCYPLTGKASVTPSKPTPIPTTTPAPSPSPAGTFPCSLCPRTFNTNFGRKIHETACRRHKGKRKEEEKDEDEDDTKEEKVEDDEEKVDESLVKDQEEQLPPKRKRGRARKCALSQSPPEPQYVCEMCDKVFNTLAACRRHEATCRRSLGGNSQDPDGYVPNVPIYNKQLNINQPAEIIITGEEVPLEAVDVKDPYVFEEGRCHCCGEDIETAHMGGEFECTDCKKLFRLKSSLERHRRVVHNEGDSYQCPECDARCPDKGTLARHMYTHTGLKPVSCPVCKTEFSRKYHLIRHNFQTGCDGSKRPSFPCQVCGRVFNRKDNLREHLRAHAGQTKRKKRYTCEECNQEFLGTTLLNLHKRTHMVGILDGDKPFGCEFCPKRFPSKGALIKHRRKHTGERPYECTFCFARFAAKETLNRHLRTHTGVKPHTCQYCGKGFIQASQLRAHVFHHSGVKLPAGEGGFDCEQCGKSFNRRQRLMLHIKYVHEGAEPFKCNGCTRTFLRKEDLSRHQLLHSGVKEHKCPICEKTFAMKSSLKIHLLTHTKEPPRSCDECGRAFIRQDCLLRHMRTKHRDMLEEIMADAEKKKLQTQLLAAANQAALQLPSEEPHVLSEASLAESVKELLTLLVDETTLKAFGWPDSSVDKLLEAVIRRCGHQPAGFPDMAYPDRLRENAKLLFTVVIDDSAVKTLLNNQTVDEVILHVLRLAKS